MILERERDAKKTTDVTDVTDRERHVIFRSSFFFVSDVAI